MNELDLVWLAGLLEGEGTFLKGPPSHPHSPVIAVVMTDKDIIERVASLFGTKFLAERKRREHWKDPFSARLRGRRAALLMQKLYPYMGQRRKQQITDALACIEGSRFKLTPANIVDIRQRSRAGEKMQALADEFRVSYSLIKKIKYGTIHSAVEITFGELA